MEYRKFKESDEQRLAEIIRDTWNYQQLSKNPEISLLMGKIYLYNCLASQNYHLVAVEGDQPVGIIMGNIKKKRKKGCLSYKRKLLQYYKQMKKNPKGEFILDLFQGFEDIDENMLKETGKKYEGELVFFVTDAKFRGKHIGTKLYEEFIKCCNEYECKNLYVYTDATCNYGFYEHQGFERKNQYLHKIYDHQFELYLYEKEFTR